MNPENFSETNDLFKQRSGDLLKRTAPLADRMRPRTLDEFIGQQHIIGEGRLLRRAIQIDQLSSLIFYGPPGTGKTTLARIIANTTKAHFLSINAVLAGVKDIRAAIERAQEFLSLYEKRTILFIDEVHRFNKSQQDALLPHVENGVLTLIGATTENPYFEVNKALVSRSRIFQLRSLDSEDLVAVALQALKDKERGYGKRKIMITDDALAHLVHVAGGDARGVLNALELAVETTSPSEGDSIRIDRSIIEDSIQRRAVLYDKDGDAHYDTISAFIKSVRGSDPDAALYWMAKMLYAGEDPRFIFRRLLILAGEDVGMADPKALGIVMDAARAFDFVGLPEGRYHLAHACLYLATAPKSNSSMAFFDAINAVSSEKNGEVPDHLRDANRDSEGLGHGVGYLYPHAYRDHWVAQQYLPDALQGKVFYQPSDQGFEKEIAIEVARRRETQVEAMVENEEQTPLSVGMNSREHLQWMERSLGKKGTQLSEIRNMLLEYADLNPSDLVLDLHTRTGMIALEAARRIRDGGVWALAHSDRSFSTMEQMTKQLDPLMRPMVIRTTFDTFVDDLRERAGKGIHFNCILGRNVLTSENNKEDLLNKITSLLASDGKCILAETVPSAAQRLSTLVDAGTIPTEIYNALIAAEQALFSTKDDPMVNWDGGTLQTILHNIDGIDGEVRTRTYHDMRVIRKSDIDHWFRRTGENDERISLGDRCVELLSGKGFSELQTVMHKQLDEKRVGWNSTVAFVYSGKTASLRKTRRKKAKSA